MFKAICAFFLFLTLVFVVPHKAHAASITSDPQYLVVNFADFYFLDWDAPEEKWQNTVKPKAVAELKKWAATLGRGTQNRQLAWSTLLEYMNFSADQPGKNSPYARQARRIMELAYETDLPVFMPLNGVQWWDELPELWNYWDHDGNQTPQCTNADHANCPYKRLRDPKYRARFIKGYNPDNKYNVDWADWKNPMGFSIRNWGGPDVWVAPSPNLAAHRRTEQTFRSVQTERYEVITKEISRVLKKWEKEGKLYLFAGLSIGTEVTLNGAVLPGDENFKPFGYRALQDTFCPALEPTCGTERKWTPQELHTMRQHILFLYFNDFARRANMKGIPKQRIYSHVWSEAEPNDPKYTDALLASFTYYSRPGLSLYGKATDPFAFSLLTNMLKQTGFTPWSAPEFSPLIRDSDNWNRALTQTLQNTTQPARLIDIYNERDIAGTPALGEIKNILASEPPEESCIISEVLPDTQNKSINPKKLSWHYLKKHDDAKTLTLMLWTNEFPQKPEKASQEIKKVSLPVNKNTYEVRASLKPGFYYWSIKRTGCDGVKWRTSEPHFFIVEKAPLKQTLQEKYARFVQKLLSFFKKYR